ncbi:hypothetical protein E2C01_092079 [Portunus trituberculatus]|uniref:Uncharacterized protein n=1 Tax=Portunus trituberculatus TaxID=210409 RepID=A0A5B7JFL6_PORTR|nr:hypothetical protein [Portunus trituberculatus]
MLACQHFLPSLWNHWANFVWEISKVQPRGHKGREVVQGHEQGALRDWPHSAPRITSQRVTEGSRTTNLAHLPPHSQYFTLTSA